MVVLDQNRECLWWHRRTLIFLDVIPKGSLLLLASDIDISLRRSHEDNVIRRISVEHLRMRLHVSHDRITLRENHLLLILKRMEVWLHWHDLLVRVKNRSLVHVRCNHLLVVVEMGINFRNELHLLITHVHWHWKWSSLSKWHLEIIWIHSF